MKKILLCELTVSEGTDAEKIAQIEGALKGTPGITVIDVDSDKDHNRSVFTWIGEPEDVLAGAMNITKKAVELVDMTKQHGSHPRMGAVDVVPFVPIRGVEQAEALEIARQYGKFLGNLGVPVYYYEDAATKPERQNLVDIRKGQYEALEVKMKDEAWRPDEGPFAFAPKSDATVTGVRFPLIAYNVNLRTDDIAVGKEIAKRPALLPGHRATARGPWHGAGVDESNELREDADPSGPRPGQVARRQLRSRPRPPVHTRRGCAPLPARPQFQDGTGRGDTPVDEFQQRWRRLRVYLSPRQR